MYLAHLHVNINNTYLLRRLYTVSAYSIACLALMCVGLVSGGYGGVSVNTRFSDQVCTANRAPEKSENIT